MAIFHGSEASYGGLAPSEIYRAFSQDNGLTWTTDNGGYPVYCRKHHQYELDQVADPCAVWINGVWWCFWTAADNNKNKFYVRGAPLAPTMKIWDGFGWAPVDQLGGGPLLAASREFVPRGRYGAGIAGSGSGGTTPPVFAFDDLPVDAGTTANAPVTLPSAAAGTAVRVHNITTGSGTVAVVAGSGDTIAATNGALTKGQTATFYCRATGAWCREG